MSIPSVRLHRDMPDGLRDRIRVVLVQPSHPGNVGACARAMRVMGLRRLVLVDPVRADVLHDSQARALSSGAADVLDAARVCASLDEALADVTLAVAISADAREFGPPLCDPDAACAAVVDELQQADAHQVALVFGPERTGLSITDAGRCQLLCAIPGESDYNSLNLAQAVQVIAYELRRTVMRRVPADAAGAGMAVRSDVDVEAGADVGAAAGDPTATVRAPQQDVEQFFQHFERALVRIGFLDPAHPKKLMARLRRLFGRARLEVDEVRLLRGLCRLIESPQPPRQGRPGS
ncbi:MAG: RNA methyltransferase [Burkholderiaceae bacterium]